MGEPEKAASVLDYENDRSLVTAPGLKRLAGTGTLFLLRHTTAGDRERWDGIDAIRPLTKKGRRQAEAIARLLADRGIERIYTSPFTRCVQTVEPLADLIGAKVVEHDALAEGPDIDAAYNLADELGGTQRRPLHPRRCHPCGDQPDDVGRPDPRVPVLLLEGLDLGSGSRRRPVHHRPIRLPLRSSEPSDALRARRPVGVQSCVDAVADQ